MYINPNKNYKRSNGDVFTGQQLKNLLSIKKADPLDKIALILSVIETDDPASADGVYGIAGK